MSCGFRGRILHVDLSAGHIAVQEPDEMFYRKRLGGKTLAAGYLLDLLPGTDPLGPGNRLVFAAGVCAGVLLPGFSRLLVAARSPLTGGFGQSEAGGFFAAALKWAGFDALVIDGRAPKPSYLWLHDGQAEIRDASFLWGKSTSQTEDILRAQLVDPRARVVCIGPGGEKLVRFAGIMHEKRNAAGRCGLGAVMGSKNLKAVVAGGEMQKVIVFDEVKVKQIARWMVNNFRENTLSYGLHTLGTAGTVAGLSASGILPTRNFSRGYLEKWEDIAGEAFAAYDVRGKCGCFACPVRCKRNVAVPPSLSGIAAGSTLPGPEYETIASFGSNLGIADRAAIIHANWLCNEAGVDTISAGATISMVTECFTRGLITAADTGGLEFAFGDAQKMIRALEMLVSREGFGDLLAQGSAFLARHWGIEGTDMQVKGMELPMHDPRGKSGVGLGYAVAAHGADHMVAGHDTLFVNSESFWFKEMKTLGLTDPVEVHALDAEKVRHFLYLEMWWEALQSLGVCLFIPAPRGAMPVQMVLDALNAVTGWNVSLWELLKTGERGTCLARVFNAREGFAREKDVLPGRFFTSSGENGSPGLDGDAFARAVSTYYAMRGWDEKGVPGQARLEELGVWQAVKPQCG